MRWGLDEEGRGLSSSATDYRARGYDGFPVEGC